MIGFIGQGFIGKHMADDFEARGHAVVRYGLEAMYIGNREAIADCSCVFVAVPTPTTPAGFDDAALRDALTLPAPGATVVIKSTIAPGHTKVLQEAFPKLIVLHSPEFLREKHAAEDTRHPKRTIIGLPTFDDVHQKAANAVLAILPPSPYHLICDSTEAELIKYGGNCFLAMKVVYMNLLYDLALQYGVNYDSVAAAMGHDHRIGMSHMQVEDRSGHVGASIGRGAGGHCFPKDLAVLRATYQGSMSHDDAGNTFLRAIEEKNNQLLRDSNKDIDLLNAIYGSTT
jgi:UDPglucose 6-dehydrogenase